jgi:hypothetical protein
MGKMLELTVLHLEADAEAAQTLAGAIENFNA